MANPPESDEDQGAAERDPGVRARLEQFLPDLMRRTFYAGLGALFTTEEGIRKLTSDFQLPKDVATYLAQQAATSKDELMRIVARELRGFLESAELQKLLQGLTLEVKTEIRFKPNEEGGTKTSIKNVALKKRDEDKAGS